MAAEGGDTVRKLIVEVVEARDLLPKDGVGTCSSYVVVDFNGQRKRTQTIHRSLNPSWNEALEFDAEGILIETCGEQLEVDLLHDKRVGPSRIRNNFVGRLRLDSKQFVRKGEEALIHFPLQKKSFFSWVRGDIGLKIYYVDVPVPVPEPPPPPLPESEKPEAAAPPEAAPEAETTAKIEEPVVAEAAQSEPPLAQEEAVAAESDLHPETDDLPSPEDGHVILDEETKAQEDGEAFVAEVQAAEAAPPPAPPPPPPTLSSRPIDQQKPFARQMSAARATDRSPEPVMEKSSFDLVEKMQYLFVRIVRARSLPKDSKPHLRISSSGCQVSTRVARKAAMFFEWEQTFAFPRHDHDTSTLESSSLEISVWDTEIIVDGGEPLLLGGISFDTPDIPIRDPPDSPLATQWYRLEGGGARRGDLMLATWIGTQADESYHQAWKADDINFSGQVNTRSKVYLSPKLWYLRLTVIEAQDLTSTVQSMSTPVSVRANLGFQSVRTRFAASRNGSPSWGEDLILVAAEQFGDQKVVLTLETRQSKEQMAGVLPVLGSAFIPLAAIERRVDDRLVTSQWLAVDLPVEEKKSKIVLGVYGAARLHVRACLDGGYHVTDEPASAASDYRPSAKQLWKQQIGTVELGIIGCKGLLPMKTVQGKGSTDAYVVAKYGQKWARTRTVAQALDPAWNEQYTWPVYDPSTVLTVGVFDDDSRQSDGQKGGAPSRPIGRVRIRISTLESGRAYPTSHPLLVLLPTGMKRMGEVELAVRFSRSVPSIDLVHVYGQPMLPAMHHLRPIAAPQREPLRSAAARMVASHLSRSDPPLRREVVMYMLEFETTPRYSMRKVRTNWHRIVASLSWAVDVARWAENTRAWRSPTATLLAHGVFVLLVWYPDLIVPAIALHVSAVGAWKYRSRPRGPAWQPWETPTTSDHVGGAVVEEIDEELDTIPSSKGHEVVRARYDRLRAVAGRVQGVLGDVAAHGERIQALVTWRDPRATGIFVVVCLFVSVLLCVVPSKVMIVGLGFHYMRHPMFRDRMPPPALNFFRRLPSLSDRFL